MLNVIEIRLNCRWHLRLICIPPGKKRVCARCLFLRVELRRHDWCTLDSTSRVKDKAAAANGTVCVNMVALTTVDMRNTA